MLADIKKRWVEALRSGKYKQGQDYLRQVSRDEERFCCLGVLCDVIAPDQWYANIDEGVLLWTYRDHSSFLPVEVLEATSLKRKEAHHLASLNDAGKSFEEIANNIEENL